MIELQCHSVVILIMSQQNISIVEAEDNINHFVVAAYSELTILMVYYVMYNLGLVYCTLIFRLTIVFCELYQVLLRCFWGIL